MTTTASQQEDYKIKQGFHDEIDLREIVTVLRRQRTFIVSVIIIAVVASVALALLMPKVYQAEVLLNPPVSRDVEILQIYDTIHNNDKQQGLTTVKYFYAIEQKEVYDKFIRFLKNRAVQYDFFEKNKIVKVPREDKGADLVERDIFAKRFGDQITIRDNREKSKQALDTITIQLNGKSEAAVVALLNNYVSFVDDYTVKTIGDTIGSKVASNKKVIESQIDSLRTMERLRRLDKIAVLSESLVIAERIGLSDQISVPLMSMQDSTVNNQNVKINIDVRPLYLRGVKVLQAELDVLQARKNDEPFIPQLRFLQKRLLFLSSIDGIGEGVHAVSINQAAIETNKPIKPKRKIIVLLGSFLGGVTALFSAFIRDWLKK